MGGQLPDRYRVATRPSLDLDRHSLSNRIEHLHRIPIRQPDTTMAGRMADRIWVIGSMNSDAFFVEADPNEPHLVSRSGRNIMEIAATFTMH